MTQEPNGHHWSTTDSQPTYQSQHHFCCAASISVFIESTTIAETSSIPSEPTASLFDSNPAWRSETVPHIPATLHRCDIRGEENSAGRYNTPQVKSLRKDHIQAQARLSPLFFPLVFHHCPVTHTPRFPTGMLLLYKPPFNGQLGSAFSFHDSAVQ